MSQICVCVCVCVCVWEGGSIFEHDHKQFVEMVFWQYALKREMHINCGPDFALRQNCNDFRLHKN